MEDLLSKTTKNILRIVENKFEKEKNSGFRNVRIWLAPRSYLDDFKETVDYMYCQDDIFEGVDYKDIHSNKLEAIRSCLNRFESSLDKQKMYIDNGKLQKPFIEGGTKIKFFYFNIIKN